MLFGLFGIVAISLMDKSKFIFAGESDPLIVKYCLMIGLVNCASFFIVYGFLQFYGIILPYYSENRTEFDKAKNKVYGILLLSPLWVSGTAAIFWKSEKFGWKIIWTLFLLYLAISLIIGLKKLKRSKT